MFLPLQPTTTAGATCFTHVVWQGGKRGVRCKVNRAKYLLVCRLLTASFCVAGVCTVAKSYVPTETLLSCHQKHIKQCWLRLRNLFIHISKYVYIYLYICMWVKCEIPSVSTCNVNYCFSAFDSFENGFKFQVLW